MERGDVLAISYGFFNSEPDTTDRNYDADDFNRIVRGLFSDGRGAGYGAPSEQFIVSTTSSPYEIRLSPGFYVVKGYWFASTEHEIIPVSNAESNLALVIQCKVWDRSLALEVVAQGDIDPETDAVLAHFTKAGDGAITVTNQFKDVAKSFGGGMSILGTATLPTGNGWMNGGRWTYTNSGILAPNQMKVWPEIADSATTQQKTQFDNCVIFTESHTAAGSIIIRAYKSTPTIALPVVFVCMST